MMLDKFLQDVSVVGAAGKMGSGISTLLLQEMAAEEARSHGRVGENGFKLHLIDVSSERLEGLRHYLHTQITKYAEKNIIQLRHWFANNPTLISNREIIDAFVNGALQIVHLDTNLEKAHSSKMVFEAVLEDPAIKRTIYQTLNKVCSPLAFFFSNTSSIPIGELGRIGGIESRIIGFHFYNPPVVQPLVEIIKPKEIDPVLDELAIALGKRLEKNLIVANDVAGFIGNGFLIREICYACAKVRELQLQYPLEEAIYIVNSISQDFLVRPMGIFQLMDYIGIDICQSIATVMGDHIGGSFKDELPDLLLSKGIKGGQNPDGSQKPGFFSYEKYDPVAIYQFEIGTYQPIATAPWKKNCQEFLGNHCEGCVCWKKLSKDKEKEEKLHDYFKHLFADTTQGAELARQYVLKLRDIAQALVDDGVAQNIQDVNEVMKLGFYHLYGPVNAFY